jgi:Xaa-Pro aminopeptidase
VANGLIPAAEFKERQRKALAEAERRGLAGLLVWSRGGYSADYYGDVAYLANYYSIFPTLPDSKHWSGRSYTGMILPVDGDPVLLVDMADWPSDVALDDVRYADYLPRAAADILREKGIAGERIGLVARNTMLLTTFQAMEDQLGHPLRYEPADDILEGLREIKSEAEKDALREAAQAGVVWMDTMMQAAEEGRTEGEIVGEGLRAFAALGGYAVGLGLGSGPREEFFRLHIPPWDTKRKLEKGDMFHVDGWGPVNNYLTDLARTTVIGGRPSAGQLEILEGVRALIGHIIDGVKPGVIASDLYRRGADWMRDNGFGSHEDTYFAGLFPASFGHGIGLYVDAPYIAENEDVELKEDMAIALEAYLTTPGLGGANFEDNILVTATGAEVLSSACHDRPWERG